MFSAGPAQAALVHRWTFNDGTANDSAGTAHGTLFGTATILDGRLELSGSSPDNRMEATLGATLGVNKTLVAWFTLSILWPDDTAGGPLGVQDAAGNVFDSITYGERTPGQWMNGSDNFNRTPADNGGALEELVEPDEIVIAIVYDDSAANKIKLYRNGVLYAEHNQGALQSFAADAMAIIGPRLVPHGYMDGYVNEARIYDAALTADQIAALTLPLMLEIVQDPQDLVAYAGETQSLVGRAIGNEPIGYQWYKDDGPLSWATSSTLDFPSLQASDAGSYFLVASNPSLTITSKVAQVVVRTDLEILSQPQDQMLFAGQTATFTVVATGAMPLSYQWFKDGEPIPGQTAASLVLPNVQTTDAGAYSVLVSNVSHTITSAVARLEVSPPRSPVTSDLALWLDATDLDADGKPDTTTEGTPVTLWQDKSGSGNDAAATGNLTYAPTGLKGSPAVAFDGASFFRTVSGGESLQAGFTMFAVFANDGMAQYDAALMWGDEATGQRRGMMRIPSGVVTFNGYNADVNSNTQVAANQSYIAAMTKGQALSDVIRVYLNGSQVAAGRAELVAYTSTAITVGANNGGGEQWNGHIAEVLVYKRELTSSELNETGLYLQFKYGINASYQVSPRLRAAAGQGAVTISWSPTAVGWILEAADELLTSSWTAVPNIMDNRVTIPTSDQRQFYRLRLE